MKEKYYNFKEIKAKFRSYRELIESTITDEEYDIFCDEIQVLPKDIVEKIQTEIQFVLLSAVSKKVNPACYINLREGFDKEKEAIIVLTPYIFGAPYIDKNGKERRIYGLEQLCILHEVAHHILRHSVCKDQRDLEDKEKAAQEQAEKWVRQWHEYRK